MANDGPPPAEEPPPLQIARLMDGYLTTQILYIAARLGVADALAAGPRAAADVAAEIGVDPGSLHRVLRGLAAEGVLEEMNGGRFGLTPLGECLRDGLPGSMRGAIVARGDLYFRAAAELLDAVRRGESAFERAYGRGFFDHLAAHPEMGGAFQGSMADRARQEAADLVAANDFGAFRRIVDVGGGSGVMLEAILASAPALRGVLFDRPPVAALARERLAGSSVAERCEFVAGDFFDAVPRGGDAYLLARVIHDWDDAAARRILAACRRAMGDDATLLLAEAVLPARARDNPAAIRMDLHMLVLFDGRERTEAEFAVLLAESGFRLSRVVPTASPVGLHLLESVPEPLPSRAAPPA